MSQRSHTYASAGVNLDAADRAKVEMREAVRSTHGPEALGPMGGFGGLFALSGLNYRDPVLVSSIDGVGTKLKIAFALNRHESVGADLVAHCVNDILVCGARPLFFLDYLALGAMDGDQAVAVVRGVAAGCREAGCALIGGETAAMPGFYAAGEYDLAGAIVGIVERNRIISGEAIREGDIALGFPSLGLHTNGYSLARQIFDNEDLAKPIPQLGRSLGDELLQPHKSYLYDMRPLLDAQLVAGMAHITGGGLVDNLPRILPDGLGVDLDATLWNILPIFRLIQRRGNVAWEEMCRVFNLGIGFIAIVHPEDEARALELVSAAGARPIGAVRALTGARVNQPRVLVEGLA
jgi:phosphoribosylformylglycinamidine cyclo-ligase